MKVFKLLYILCLLGTIVFGDIPVVGIIIVRYIATAVLFFICCTQRISYPSQKIYKVYFLFLFFFFLTSVYSGYSTDYLKVFFGTYFVSIVWIWATYILIIKYESLNLLISSLLIICTINALVTIGQYFRNPVAFGISYLLNVVNDDTVASMAEHVGSSETFSGFAMYGLLGAVPNGYYSAVFSVISCIFLYKSKNIIFKVVSLAFWAFAVFALFCVQERAALIGGVFFSGWYIIKILASNSRGKVLMVLIMVISFFVLINKGPELFTFTEGTRYESFDLDSRTSIFATSKEYIFQHPFNANLFEYVDKYKKFPHHIVYYSFMCGMWLGGVLILGTFVYILILAFKLSTKKVYDNNVLSILTSFSLFAYSVPSLTHNDSIASGATLFWILAAAVITSYERSKTMPFHYMDKKVN